MPFFAEVVLLGVLDVEEEPGVGGRVGRVELALPGVDEVLRRDRPRVVPFVQPMLSGRMLNVQTEASSFG